MFSSLKHKGLGRVAKIRGYSLVELMVTIVIGATLTAMAVPQVISAVQNYQQQAALNQMVAAIQSTRYQAIFQGNTIRMAMSKSTSAYQLSSAPGNTTVFSNVGSAIALPGTINADTTLEFHPSGFVKATTGALNFNLTYHSMCNVMTVTSYGNVSYAGC